MRFYHKNINQKYRQIQREENGLIFKIILILIVLLGVVNLSISNQLAIYGEELKKKEDQIQILENQNQEMKRKIAQESSLQKILVKAKKLGFKPSFSAYYLKQYVSMMAMK
jgi:cell division protein FtsL